VEGRYVIVARLTVQFLLPGCSSLKEKRFVLASLKARLRNKFNVALCETGYQDKWRRSELGLVTVATGRRGAEKVVQSVLSFLEREHRIELLEIEREFG
jgi:uncharacterized protein YlxP (DUF503 family)